MFDIMGEKMPLVASVNDDNDVKEVSSISYFGDKEDASFL
jgi:hypothetical protein